MNIKIGGAFQRAISFLNELKNIGHDEYHIFYNVDLDREINTDVFPKTLNFTFLKIVPQDYVIEKRLSLDLML